MIRIDFVVPISANQHQVPHIRLSQQVLDYIQRCGVEPMQVVEKERERMLGSCEYADESAKHQLEATLRILWRESGNQWLLSDYKLQFRNEIDDKPPVRAHCLLNGIAPVSQLSFFLTQEGADKPLKRLNQSGIRNVTLVLVELARGKHAA